MLSYKLTIPPVVEPVSLSLAKSQCRIDGTYDDALLSIYITAARQYCEKQTNRAFFNQTYTLSMDNFPYGLPRSVIGRHEQKEVLYSGFWKDYTILLPKPRLVSVTSICYTDLDGNVQTISPTSYTIDTISEPARIMPGPGTFWPYLQTYLPGTVKITYVTGSYGDGVRVNNCPQTIVLAMLLLISHWYEHRESATELNLKNIPNGVDELLAEERFTCLSYEAVN